MYYCTNSSIHTALGTVQIQSGTQDFRSWLEMRLPPPFMQGKGRYSKCRRRDLNMKILLYIRYGMIQHCSSFVCDSWASQEHGSTTTVVAVWTPCSLDTDVQRPCIDLCFPPNGNCSSKNEPCRRWQGISELLLLHPVRVYQFQFLGFARARQVAHNLVDLCWSQAANERRC